MQKWSQEIPCCILPIKIEHSHKLYKLIRLPYTSQKSHLQNLSNQYYFYLVIKITNFDNIPTHN